MRRRMRSNVEWWSLHLLNDCDSENSYRPGFGRSRSHAAASHVSRLTLDPTIRRWYKSQNRSCFWMPAPCRSRMEPWSWSRLRTNGTEYSIYVKTARVVIQKVHTFLVSILIDDSVHVSSARNYRACYSGKRLYIGKDSILRMITELQIKFPSLFPNPTRWNPHLVNRLR